MAKFFLCVSLVFLQAFAFANDACEFAIDLLPGTSCTYTIGSFNGATLTGTPPNCGTSSQQDVWYKFTATTVTNRIYIDATNNLDTGFEIYAGSCSGNLFQCTNNNSTNREEIYLGNTFVVGQTYYIRVFNVRPGTSTLSFNICLTAYPTTPNDLCANAQEIIPVTSYSYTQGTFRGSSRDGNPSTCATNVSQDIWYKFTATDVTHRIYLNYTNNLDLAYEVYENNCNGSLINCVNNYSSSREETHIGNTFVVGRTYYIRVMNVSTQLSTLGIEICILKYPTPANDLCPNAQELTPVTSYTYTQGSFAGTLFDGNTATCAPNSVQDVWFKFTATDVTNRIFVNYINNLDIAFEVYENNCQGNMIRCVNSNSTTREETHISNTYVVGRTYLIRVLNVSAQLSTLPLEICVIKYSTPINDLCTNAREIIPITNYTYTQGTFAGTLFDGNTSTCSPNAVQDAWFKFTATDVTNRVFLNYVNNLDVAYEIYENDCNGTLIRCVNDNNTGREETHLTNTYVVGRTYYIRVINVTSQLSTLPIEIVVIKYTTPQNNACSNAQEIIPTPTYSPVNGTLAGTLNNGNPSMCAPNGSQDVWYKFTANAQTMRIYLNDGTDLDHAMEIYQGDCNGTLIRCINDNSTNREELYFNNNFVIGQTYFIRVINTKSTLSTAAFGISVQYYTAPLNNQCENAFEIAPNPTCSYTNGTFSGSTLNGGTANCANTASQDVWYKFTSTASLMSISLQAVSGLNHSFQVFETDCAGTLMNCTNANAIHYGETATLNNLVIGQTYVIRVLNASTALSTATFGICLTGPSPISCTPSVSIQAQRTTICQGENITFSASSVNGGSAPNYIWKIDGIATGSNGNTFTTSNLYQGNTVTCTLVSNASCATPNSVNSNSISMTVTANQASIFTVVSPICAGTSFTLPTISTNGIQGTWSPMENNLQTTSYTFTPFTGQCAQTANMTVTVNQANIIPEFNAIQPICSGETFTLPQTSINNIQGSWSPTINTNATTLYTFLPIHGQCARETEITVVVNSVNTTVTQTANTLSASASNASYQWINCSTNTSINGATNAFFTPIENGSYAVRITQNNCSKTSDCFAITQLNTFNINEEKWTIYPNPSQGKIFVTAATTCEITLVDLTGKILAVYNLTEGKQQIDLSSYTPGLYFIYHSQKMIDRIILE